MLQLFSQKNQTNDFCGFYIYNTNPQKSLDLRFLRIYYKGMKSARIVKKTEVIGRDFETQTLNKFFSKESSQLVVCYGRRRVGKSFFLKNYETSYSKIYFEGLEDAEGEVQLQHFIKMFLEQIDNSCYAKYAKLKINSWRDFFEMLSDFLNNEKKLSKVKKLSSTSNRYIVIFDEFQWMAKGKSEVVSIFKYFWDNFYLNSHHHFILCGSISSYMINKVIKSKALYGRINLELHMKALPLLDALKFFKKKRSLDEIINYFFVFGGIPKYLEEINLNQSFEQNINSLCFQREAIFLNEYHRIFYQQFKSAKTYERIVKLLSKEPHTLQEISQKLDIRSGGGLQSYLKILEDADFIKEIVPFHKQNTTKAKKFKLIDEYINFYFSFIEPNIRLIRESEHTVSSLNANKNFFSKITNKRWDIWRGLAFENFVFKNASLIAEHFGFLDQVKSIGPFFPVKNFQVQFDLIFERFDNVLTICEVKNHKTKLGLEQIGIFEKKLTHFPVNNFKNYTIERALISMNEIDQNLIDSKYFHHTISVKDLFVNEL